MDKLQVERNKTKIILEEPTLIMVLTERVPELIPGTDEVGIPLFDGNNFVLEFDEETEAKKTFWRIARAGNPLAYAKAIFNSPEQMNRRISSPEGD